MIRQDIMLNDYKYIVDLYKANTDIKDNVYADFVMFRRINVTNTISYDTDIYIIEKSVFKDVFENNLLDSSSASFSNICFPMPNWNLTQFSASIKDLNKDFYIKNNDTAEDFIDRHGYRFYNQNGNETALLCDKIRIYHPSIVRTLKYIIYVSNYINDINFHFYCACSNSLSTNSSEDFSIDNFKYSEYYEFLVPNIEYLFSTNMQNFENKNVYFKENLNVVAEYDYGDDNVLKSSKDYYGLIPISLLIEPFEIQKTNITYKGTKYDVYQKKYIYIRKSIENNYLTYPLNIYLYPYNAINSNNVYELTDGFLSNGDTFISECKFKLNAKVGFNDNGVISLLGDFSYPNMDEFQRLYGDKGLNKAYQLYNNISYADYKNWSFEDYDYYNIDDSEGYNFTNYEFYVKEINNIEYNGMLPKSYKVRLYNATLKKMVIPSDSMQLICVNTLLSCKINNAIHVYIIDDILTSTNEYIIKPYNIETAVALKPMSETKKIKLKVYNNYGVSSVTYNDIFLIGYKITIASDIRFKNIIYTLKIEEKFDEYEDEHDILSPFAFKLNGLFSSWDEMPELLVAKVEFIDRLLGIQINSNFVPITKEWFKYMINDIDVHYINLSKYKHTLTDMNIETSRVNFIDRINCTINKVDNTASSSDVQNVNYNNAAPKILYKPIFYKAQTLNNIRIKSGIVQNVGINLNNYLTKVETFKLIIDGNLYVESGRNDIYAIFRVNPLELENNAGTYVIANQDDEYISDGQYIIY